MTWAQALKGKRFLLAEDNGFARDAMREMLLAHGAQAVMAQDGEAAVNLFAMAREGTFDAVILDINMPEMSGFDAAAAIRRMNRWDAGRVPIFVLSAAAPQYCRKEAEESGVDVCLQKPVQMRELARLMNGLNNDICSGQGSGGT